MILFQVWKGSLLATNKGWNEFLEQNLEFRS